MNAYKQVLAQTGVRQLLATTTLARLPVTATTIVLTLHVILSRGQGGLDLDYAAAGAVAAATAIGTGIGSPLLGRLLDRTGLLPVVLITMTAQVAFWGTVRFMPYRVLVPLAFIGGLLALPVFVISRQSLTVLVPDGQRQAGFALDSMSVELAFAVGPALGAAVITQFGSVIALNGLAAAFLASGLALLILAPPVHMPAEPDAESTGETGETGETDATANTATGSWLNRRIIGVLLVAVATTVTLGGTDVTITARMREFGEIKLVGLVISVWCLGSLVGGFVYGSMRRRISPIILLFFLAALTLPVGLATSWWLLAIFLLPSTVFCAPVITATIDKLVALSPQSQRGATLGAHTSALTLGISIGAPLAGVTVDATSPAWGFFAVGVGGLLIAIPAAVLMRSRTYKRTGSDPLAANRSSTADAAIGRSKK